MNFTNQKYDKPHLHVDFLRVFGEVCCRQHRVFSTAKKFNHGVSKFHQRRFLDESNRINQSNCIAKPPRRHGNSVTQARDLLSIGTTRNILSCESRRNRTITEAWVKRKNRSKFFPRIYNIQNIGVKFFRY